MKQIKILVTADIHFEKIPVEERDSFLNYIIDTIKARKSDIMVFAGDTADSRNLRAESDDFKALYCFIRAIMMACKEVGTTFIILKGTPSHDGDVMQNICMLMPNDILYIDEMKSELIHGLSIGFIPELYESKYETFLDNLHSTFRSTQDIIFYHGMMDYAIPALKQIDSEYSLRKSLVMKYKDITPYSHSLVIGGHVHKYMHIGDCYYTGRAIPKPGEVTREQIFAIHEIILENKSYTIKHISNPNVKDVFSWTIDFTKEHLEDLISRAEKYPNDGYKLKVILDHSTECKDKWNQFLKVIKPMYYQVKMVQVERDLKSVKVESKDVDTLVLEFYKNKTNKKITDSIIEEIGIHTQN